jgi:hypothetical protein
MGTTITTRARVVIFPGMLPSPFVRVADSSGRRGFTLVGALTSLAVLAAAVAVSAPLIVKRLRARVPAADATARRVEAAVARGLDSVGALADAYSGSLAALPRVDAGEAGAASLPDRPAVFPADPAVAWDGLVNPSFPAPWRNHPLLGRPLFPRAAPWDFYRHPRWRAGGAHWK